MRRFQISHLLQAATSKTNTAMSVKIEVVLGALIENGVVTAPLELPVFWSLKFVGCASLQCCMLAECLVMQPVQ